MAALLIKYEQLKFDARKPKFKFDQYYKENLTELRKAGDYIL